MKALLLKDVYELRKQFGIFALTILLFAVLPFGYLNAFALTYTVFLPMSLMATDETSHWNQLSAMLPYTAKERVVHLYVVSWVSGLATMAISLLVRLVTAPFHLPLLPFALIVTTYFLVQCWTALMIPLMIRFGATKSRLIRFLIIGAACGTSGSIGARELVAGGAPFSDLPVALVMLAVAAVATAISIPVAARWLERSDL